MPKILENGQMRGMTADEIEVANAHTKINQDAKTAKAVEETAKETNQVSGKQKLKDLGLNDDEIKSLMGV
jgi:hypothetical protein